MNTQNVKTAASESSERWGEGQEIGFLSAELSESLAYLKALGKTLMTEDERAELLLGKLIEIATLISNTVSDWSTPRPLLPVASLRAWVQASHIAHDLFGETGDTAWGNASKYLADMLNAGYGGNM
ncbi:hypothetical protein [Erwinia amylovora]|uniref:hypothetical protein n=1 Tax=Erwinia amylovora TaxID=552 RepID=UPI0014440A0B|nr:hypothetical protein [Erwinia amylovora]